MEHPKPLRAWRVRREHTVVLSATVLALLVFADSFFYPIAGCASEFKDCNGRIDMLGVRLDVGCKVAPDVGYLITKGTVQLREVGECHRIPFTDWNGRKLSHYSSQARGRRCGRSPLPSRPGRRRKSK